jgi:hypothetical protein
LQKLQQLETGRVPYLLLKQRVAFNSTRRDRNAPEIRALTIMRGSPGLQLPPGDHQPGSPQDRRSSQPSQVDPKKLRCQKISTPKNISLRCTSLFFFYKLSQYFSLSHNLSQVHQPPPPLSSNAKSVGLGHLALAAARRMQGDTTLRASPPARQVQGMRGLITGRDMIGAVQARSTTASPPPYLGGSTSSCESRGGRGLPGLICANANHVRS